MVNLRLHDGATTLILVVDDEIAILHLVKSILQDAGYQVRLANRAADALRILGEGIPPQLLLTDIVMPGTSGIALAANAHRLLPDLPVIFMTGYAHDYEDELTGSVCLKKPFTLAQLLLAVSDVLSAPPKASRGGGAPQQ
ncbi:MAG TPA: response regulator [Bryobacteraceae bacterium]